MPTYEYRCTKCGEDFEVFQSFSEDALKKHPGRCGGKVVKVLSPAGIVFSGSGFYKTDNRSGRNGGNGHKSEGSESSSSSEKSSSAEKSSSSETSKSSDKSGSSGSSSSSSSTETKKSA